VAVLDEGEIGRPGRKGHSSRGAPISYPGLGGSSACRRHRRPVPAHDYLCVARTRRQQRRAGAVSTAAPTAPTRHERSASARPHPNVPRTPDLGPGRLPNAERFRGSRPSAQATPRARPRLGAHPAMSSTTSEPGLGASGLTGNRLQTPSARRGSRRPRLGPHSLGSIVAPRMIKRAPRVTVRPDCEGAEGAVPRSSSAKQVGQMPLVACRLA
jgi:hypothetical protein